MDDEKWRYIHSMTWTAAELVLLRQSIRKNGVDDWRTLGDWSQVRKKRTFCHFFYRTALHCRKGDAPGLLVWRPKRGRFFVFFCLPKLFASPVSCLTLTGCSKACSVASITAQTKVWLSSGLGLGASRPIDSSFLPVDMVSSRKDRRNKTFNTERAVRTKCGEIRKRTGRRVQCRGGQSDGFAVIG